MDIVKLIVSLGLVCVIGCAALVWVNDVTAEPRRVVNAEILRDNLQDVLPADMQDVSWYMKQSFEGTPVYVARDKMRAVAVVKTSGSGFGGPIDLLVGIDLNTDKIVRIITTAHSETPGLGSQATDRKVKKSIWKKSTLKPGEIPANKFLDGNFIDMEATSFSLDGSGASQKISGVSGATYSSRGVVQAVNAACAVYQMHKNEIVKGE